MLVIFWHNWTHSLWTHLSAFSLRERKKWTVTPFHGLKVQTDLTKYWNNEFFSHSEASSYQYSMTINMDTLLLYFFDETDRGNSLWWLYIKCDKKYEKSPKKATRKMKREWTQIKSIWTPPPPPYPTPATLPQKITVSCWQKQAHRLMLTKTGQ